jgi:hypothetical protein
MMRGESKIVMKYLERMVLLVMRMKLEINVLEIIPTKQNKN